MFHHDRDNLLMVHYIVNSMCIPNAYTTTIDAHNVELINLDVFDIDRSNLACAATGIAHIYNIITMNYLYFRAKEKKIWKIY